MLTTPKIASHSVSAKATKRKPIADRIQQARTRELYLFKKKNGYYVIFEVRVIYILTGHGMV